MGRRNDHWKRPCGEQNSKDALRFENYQAADRKICDLHFCHKPRIIHFSGHESSTGLAFEDNVGTVRVVKPKAMASRLRAVRSRSCYPKFLLLCREIKRYSGQCQLSHRDERQSQRSCSYRIYTFFLWCTWSRLGTWGGVQLGCCWRQIQSSVDALDAVLIQKLTSPAYKFNEALEADFSSSELLK